MEKQCTQLRFCGGPALKPIAALVLVRMECFQTQALHRLPRRGGHYVLLFTITWAPCDADTSHCLPIQ